MKWLDILDDALVVLWRLLIVVCLVWFCWGVSPASAASGSVVLSNGWSVTATDNSCSAVGDALNVGLASGALTGSGYRVLGCSSSVLSTASSIFASNGGGITFLSIKSMSASGAVSPSSVMSSVNTLSNEYQNLLTSVTSLQSTVTSLQASVNAINSQLATLGNSVANTNAILNEPFDLTIALLATSFFMGSVIFMWAVSKAAGSVLSAIRPVGYRR